MGTFHSDKGPLHGITVVVDTHGPVLYVGRCDMMDAERIILHDADEHSEGEGGRTKEEYLARAAMVGIWKKHDTIAIPMSRVSSVKRLGEL